MQSLKDIFSSTDITPVYIRDAKRVKSPRIEALDSDYINDLQSDPLWDISLKKHTKIQLSKKSGADFDALEKKKKKKKDIIIRKKTSLFSLHDSIIIGITKIKRMWYVGNLYLFIAVFSLLGWFLFLDKLIVENRVNAWYEKLVSIKSGGYNLEEIKKQVNNARFDLFLADILFYPFRLLPGEKIDSISHVISGWRYITKSMDDALGLYTFTDEYINTKGLKNIYFTELLEILRPDLKDIENSLEKSLSSYKAISWLPNTSLLEQKNAQIENLQEALSYISTLNKDFDSIKSLLGHETRKKYLIVFQNADEIRPTGGFMGSMWLLEIFRGRVQLFQKKDVYAIEWDLKSADYERLAPPKGIDTLTETFWLRDANYFINLQDSSETIEFFTKRAGLDIDGVVYINQWSLLRMLDASWPVYSEALEREISSDNFSEIMSLVVEAKVFKKWTLGTPKKALFDFMEEYAKKLSEQWNYFDYMRVILHEIKSREILAWSFDESNRKALVDLKLVWEIDYDSTLDFAYPVYTSISWNKSDRYMKKLYTQTVKKWESCSYDVDFTIKSTHDMGKMKRERIQSLISEFNLDSPNLFEIQWASPNKQYMRVILPHDANIIPQDGMEIVDYWSRKWVEFFLTTELQQSSFYTISYNLPNPECKTYNYTLYKQPWVKSFDIYMNIGWENYEYRGREEDFYFEER